MCPIVSFCATLGVGMIPQEFAHFVANIEVGMFLNLPIILQTTGIIIVIFVLMTEHFVRWVSFHIINY